ncbi:MAG: hypothetical protein A3K10_16855 [Bacteroidetes bacterium RIFCSPLOWO2_12_FULL_31_6]|nr:MAG: hypothetical protein A3K10_16855 [Bacteroidetes bacterium RIFCSPLOWO2_12_FULL_31_6]
MLISVFKSNQKLVNGFSIIVVFCLWLPLFWHNNSIVINKYSVFNVISAINNIKLLSFAFAVLLISAQAIYINHIVNHFKIIANNTHLVSLFYVLWCAANSSLLIVTPILIANSFLLLAVYQLFNMYGAERVYSLAFNSGLLVAIAMLIYLPAVLFLPLLWVVLIYTKTPNWREFVISMVGFAVPVIFYLTYYLITNQLTALLNDTPNNHLIFLKEQLPVSHFGRSFFYASIVVGLLALINLIINIDKNVVKIRKLLLMVMLMLLFFGCSLFINSFDYLATYLLVGLPFSILLANYFNQMKRLWFSELIFLGLIVTLIFSYFS